MAEPVGDVEELLALETERCRRVEAGDWDGIAEILADDFTYTHSNGHTDPKTKWIESIKSRHRLMDMEDTAVRVLGDVALMTGIIVLHVDYPDDTVLVVILDAFRVWVRRDGRWSLLVQHNVKNLYDARQPGNIVS